MKRILVITGHLARNGTETFIMGLYRHIDREKIQFDFLLGSKAENGYEDEAMQLGAKIYATKYTRRQYFRYGKELDAFFKKHAAEYVAVYFHGNSFTSIMSVHYAKKYGIPLRILHCHNTTAKGFHNRLFHRINRCFVPNTANMFLACSDGARVWGYGRTKAFSQSVVLKNGVDIEKFRYNVLTRDAIRAQFHMVDDFVVGMVGRLDTEKNVFFAIDIFKKLKSIKNNAVLVLVGDGPLKSQLIQYVDRLDLTDSVCFLGVRTDVNKLFQLFDVMLMPSLFEGFPFVLVEAQAANLPIVLSSSISRAVQLSDPVYFMDLKAGPQAWAKKIGSINYTREDGFVDHRLLDYDMQKTADFFSKMVLDRIENQRLS